MNPGIETGNVRVNLDPTKFGENIGWFVAGGEFMFTFTIPVAG